MPPTPNTSRTNPPPLVVDLDGTLIKTDLLWESLAQALRRNPFVLFAVLLWWMRGRAFLKRQLARRVTIDPATLPWNEPFLAFLREQKQAGRKLILATASDRDIALPVAAHVALFDEVLGSDGKTNLRSTAKLKVLTEKFGERGFDYAGNSAPDLPVWRGAREAIVVNASRRLVQRVKQCANPGPVFTDGYSPFAILKRFLGELLWRSGYLSAIGAGLLLTAAFPKIGIAGFAWIAPALMIFAASGKSAGDTFRVGYIAGLAHFLSSLCWLLLIPVTGFPILGWVSLCAYLALYPAVWVWLVSNSKSQIQNSESWAGRTFWSLLGAASWVALEMVRARLFSGFPWNLLGVSQYKLIPLIQIASVTGVHGVSFLVVWISLSLFSAARMIFRRPTVRFIWQADIILPLAAVVALFAFGFARMNAQNPSDSSLRITLVQPAIPQTLIWDSSENDKRFTELLTLSEQALTNKTDLLIWPESAVPGLDETNYVAITNLIRTHHVWLILNADDVELRSTAKNKNDFDVYNSAFLFNPEGRCEAVYHKQKLVIFGEYIPLVRWLPFVKWFTPITGGFASGANAVPFELERVKTAVLICFEDVFPQLAREYVQDDTDFLVNLTNDGWFGHGSAQLQQAAASAFRAVENGLPLVRSCNDGITCWIDAHGRLRETFRDKNSSEYGVGSMTINVPLLHPGEKRAPTFYNRHGDWFGWGCVLLTGAILVRRLFPC